MTSRFSVLLKKYSIPILLFIAGIIMLVFGIRENQDSTFMISCIMMFAAGGMSILYSSGKFNAKLALFIGLIAGVAAVIILGISYTSVRETEKYMADYDMCKSLAKQNLEDIRYIQKAFLEKNGRYAANWDELVEFTTTGTIPFVESVGPVPARKITEAERNYLYHDNRAIDDDMTEAEAYRLSKWTEGPLWQDFSNFKRDTIQVSLLKTKFQSRSYKENRSKMGFYAFSPDSLPIIPFTKGKQWLMETKDSVKVGDVVLPSLRVYGKIPFASIKGKNNDTEEMFFGSLTTHDLDGSWENE